MSRATGTPTSFHFTAESVPSCQRPRHDNRRLVSSLAYSVPRGQQHDGRYPLEDRRARSAACSRMFERKEESSTNAHRKRNDGRVAAGGHDAEKKRGG